MRPSWPRKGFAVVKNVSMSCPLSLLARVIYFSCSRCDAMISSRIVSRPRVIFQFG
jgi:hypothetical protein